MQVKINKGINFEVVKIKKDFNFFELNKYLIPRYEFNDIIDEICNG